VISQPNSLLQGRPRPRQGLVKTHGGQWRGGGVAGGMAWATSHAASCATRRAQGLLAWSLEFAEGSSAGRCQACKWCAFSVRRCWHEA